MKIGIYAGAFDPIHEGHLEFAEEAILQADLDRIIIVAEKTPYRKKPFASWDHRQAMIERATEDLEKVDHDYNFANSLAHQHTMKDMIAVARKHYGKEVEFWFLVGSDIFEHIHKWEDLLNSEDYGGFVVAMKDNFTYSWLQEKLSELKDKRIALKVKVIEHQNKQASSSKIREEISESQSPTGLKSDVLLYCQQHQLYR